MSARVAVRTRPRGVVRAAGALLSAALLLGLGGCSTLPFHHKKPVPLEPPPAAVTAPPDTTARAASTSDTTASKPAPKHTSVTRTRPAPRSGAGADSVATVSQPVTPVETMDPVERARTLSRTVADTTHAGQALRRCSGRAVMPDQEATLDAVRNLLAQTRAALASGELWRAESLARKARQLASSLNCP